MDDVFERTVPHDLEAERAVLGALLIREDVFDAVAEVVREEDFFRDAHRRIFRQVQTLSRRSVAVDPVTLLDALRKTGDVDEAGGPSYIGGLIDGVPRSVNAEHYARIVREKADLRRVIATATKMLAEAYDAEDDAKQVIERAEQAMFALGSDGVIGGFQSLSTIMARSLERLESWYRTKSGITGVATGFLDLDWHTCGLEPGQFVVVGARPSIGKSAFGLNIGHHVAGSGKVAALFSLEMSADELGIRLLSAEAEVDSHQMRRGQIRESDWVRISQGIESLSGTRLFIDDTPYLTAWDMRTRARRLKAQHGLDLIIVDYVQLAEGHEKRSRADNRALELASISRALKGVAKELGVPVITLAQVSRKCEERQDKRPLLSDLRESGALEQDADIVLFLYRDEVYGQTEKNRGQAEVIIAKQRNGPTGTVRLTWDAEHQRFLNAAVEEYATDQRLPIGDRE